MNNRENVFRLAPDAGSHHFARTATVQPLHGRSWIRRVTRSLVAAFLVFGFPASWNPAIGAELFPARIYSGTSAIAAIACGDFDPNHSGKELACLLADGRVVEVALGASGWTTSTIYAFQGNPPWLDPRMRVALNLGDVLSTHAGLEIVAGFTGQTVAIYYEPSIRWTNQATEDLGFGTYWGTD